MGYDILRELQACGNAVRDIYYHHAVIVGASWRFSGAVYQRVVKAPQACHILPRHHRAEGPTTTIGWLLANPAFSICKMCLLP